MSSSVQDSTCSTITTKPSTLDSGRSVSGARPKAWSEAAATRNVADEHDHELQRQPEDGRARDGRQRAASQHGEHETDDHRYSHRQEGGGETDAGVEHGDEPNGTGPIGGAATSPMPAGCGGA